LARDGGYAAGGKGGSRDGEVSFGLAATCADIVALAEEWEELAAAAIQPVMPFQRPAWALACARLMEEGLCGGRPAVLAARRGGRLVCVAPLAFHNSSGGLRAEWIGGRFAAYGDVVVRAGEDAAALVSQLLDELRRRCCWASLDGVRAETTLAGCLPQDRFEPSDAAPYLDLSGFSTPEDFDLSRSRATRKNWLRKERKLAELGVVGFDFNAGAVARERIGEIFAMKRKWARCNGILSRSIEDPAFERLIADLAGSMDGLRISTLLLDGRPVAIELGVVAESRYLSYLCAYDTDFAALSPGVLQMRRTIAAVIAEGVSCFDLMPPADDYKLQWTDRTMPVMALRMTFAKSPVIAALARIHAADLPRQAAGAIPPRFRPALARAASAGRHFSRAASAVKGRAAAMLAAMVSLAGATAFILAAAE